MASEACRIVYVGPHGPSKALALRRLAAALPPEGRGPLRTLRTAVGRILTLEVRRDGDPEGAPPCEVVTMPVSRAGGAEVRLLLRDAAAIVFVPDPDDPGGRACRRSARTLVLELASTGRRDGLPPIVVDTSEAGVEACLGLASEFGSGATVEISRGVAGTRGGAAAVLQRALALAPVAVVPAISVSRGTAGAGRHGEAESRREASCPPLRDARGAGGGDARPPVPAAFAILLAVAAVVGAAVIAVLARI